METLATMMQDLKDLREKATIATEEEITIVATKMSMKGSAAMFNRKEKYIEIHCDVVAFVLVGGEMALIKT